jgi:phosphopantothenoylcysteine synthetase/decarboxylase
MADAVSEELGSVDAAFFAAAVADFRPDAAAAEKIRREGRSALVLELQPTRDVLGEAIARAPAALLVGFAAETEEDLEAAARRKLRAKGCDLLVANRVDGPRGAFDADDNEVLVLGPGTRVRRVPRAPKRAVADELLDAALAALEEGAPGRRRPSPVAGS